MDYNSFWMVFLEEEEPYLHKTTPEKNRMGRQFRKSLLQAQEKQTCLYLDFELLTFKTAIFFSVV